MAQILFRLMITYLTCLSTIRRVVGAPSLPNESQMTTEQPTMNPLLQALLDQTGQHSSGMDDATGSPAGMNFDISMNQGDTETHSAQGMTFNFNSSTGSFAPDGQSSGSANPLAKFVPDEGSTDGWSFDLDDLFLGADCDDSCKDFHDVCSGEDQCDLLDNCTAVCHKADGTTAILYSKELRPTEERTCTQTGKVCVHGECLDDQNCKCDIGYEGDLCEVKQCDLPCLNGGTCFKLEDESLACACTPDWQGVLCTDKKCRLPCVHGSCLYSEQNGTAYCNCHHGWTSDYCDKEVPDPAASAKTRALLVGITVPVVCALVLMISWYILWRKRAIFVFKVINMFKAYEDGDDKVYDAYVSLTDADHVFVKHVLQPKLEAMGHKLYLHARDGVAGDVKSEEILEAVKKSRRCIMLLSTDYVSNEWCRFEYLIAQHETCIKLKQRIIPILMDDIDKDKKKMDKTLRFIVDSVKCLRYPKPPEELSPVPTSVTQLQPDIPKSKELTKFEKKQAKFWQRLGLIMPKKRDTGKEKCPLSAGNAKPPYTNDKTKRGLGVFFSKLPKTLNVYANNEKSSSSEFSIIEPTSSSEKLSELNPVTLLGVTARVDPKLDSFYSDMLDRSLTGESKDNSLALPEENVKRIATEDVGHVYIKM